MTIIHSNIYLYKLLNAVHVQPTMPNTWDCPNAEDRKKIDFERQWQKVLTELGDISGLTPEGQWAAIMVYHPEVIPKPPHRGEIRYQLTTVGFMEKATWLYIKNHGYSPTHTANHPFP
jgi:hypothetical protein